MQDSRTDTDVSQSETKTPSATTTQVAPGVAQNQPQQSTSISLNTLLDPGVAQKTLQLAFSSDNPGRNLGVVGIVWGGIGLLTLIVNMTTAVTGVSWSTSSVPAAIQPILLFATPAGIVFGIISYFQSRKANKSRLPGKLSLSVVAATYATGMAFWFIVLTILAMGSSH